jgi:sugar lactone lactonase YvrE
LDANGNVYVSDWGTNRIFKSTPSGNVTTLAGSGLEGGTDGQGISAKFYLPQGVAVDGSGNIYVADSGTQGIRKITPSGNVTTLAGTQSYTSASLWYPEGVTVDATGNLFVADTSNHKIRKITPAGVVTTLAGSGAAGSIDGTGTAASFYYPSDVAVDSSGNAYVADSRNNKIRKITPSGVVTTLAGSGELGFADGQGISAKFYLPQGVAVDGSGNIYLADSYNYRIRKITPSGIVTTLVSSEEMPSAVALDSSGNIYVVYYTGGVIRKITVSQ